MPLVVVVVLLLFSATPAWAQSSTDQTIAVRGAVLAATVTLPAGAGPHPAVVLIGGSGPSTRQALRKFSTQFNTEGFATLVFDKRGSGESTGSWTSASFEDNVADAAAAIALLQQDSRIDRRRVGVWGVSQAGWFVPALAVRAPSLAFAIILTGGGATPREVEMFMHEAALERANVGAAGRAKAREMLDAYFAWLGTGRDRQRVVELINEAKTQPWYAAVAIDGVMPSDEGRPNWEWVARYNPMPDIERMTLPTLVLLGGDDLMGSPAVAAERWQAGLAKAGNSRATVTTISGMGHAATIGAGHAQGGAVMPEYTRAVATFLATVR
jgi:pimeloyl-ACP methyl ester carboxylesterase